jgi:hypothetical protein
VRHKYSTETDIHIGSGFISSFSIALGQPGVRQRHGQGGVEWCVVCPFVDASRRLGLFSSRFAACLRGSCLIEAGGGGQRWNSKSYGKRPRYPIWLWSGFSLVLWSTSEVPYMHLSIHFSADAHTKLHDDRHITSIVAGERSRCCTYWDTSVPFVTCSVVRRGHVMRSLCT